MLAGVAVLLVLSVIAGVVALEQRGSARKQAVAADAQRFGARALVEDDLDRALLLARQGVALDDSVQTRGNLLAALLKSPAALGLLRGDEEPIAAIALSPDERTLAAGTNTNKIFLFDTRTRRRLATLRWMSGAFIQLAFSPDGRRFAVGYDLTPGAAVAMFDVRRRLVVARISPPPARGISGLEYSPDGRGRRHRCPVLPLATRAGGAHALRLANGRAAIRSRSRQPCRQDVADDHERRAPLGGRRGGRDHSARCEEPAPLQRWPVGGHESRSIGRQPLLLTTTRWRSALRTAPYDCST